MCPLGKSRCPLYNVNAGGIYNISDGCHLFDQFTGRKATSLVCMGRLRRDGQCCGREAQCGWRTKINWTKTAHNIRICTCICGHLGLVPTHTHARTVVCGYGLSSGPTEGLSSWWSREICYLQQLTTTTAL